MSFGSDMRAYANKQKRNLNDVVFESLVGVSGQVIIKTPVLSAALANSWRPTTRAPSNSDQQFTSDAAQRTAIKSRVQFALDGAGVYYLVNNQPYAHKVEFLGHSSRKAPAGMLRVSIENFQQFIDNEIGKL